MTVINAAERFEARALRWIEPGNPHAFVADRCLDMRITMRRSGHTTLLTQAPAAVAARALTFVRGAEPVIPAAGSCWGVLYDESACGWAELFYDPEYIACLGQDTPPDTLSVTNGDELLQIRFTPALTPDDVLWLGWQ